MGFQPEHLQEVERCRTQFDPTRDEQAAGNPAQWLENVSRKLDRELDWDSLPSKECQRYDVFEYVRRPTPTELACACILGWGGMRRSHGEMLFRTEAWLKVAKRIRSGELNRKQSYDEFAELRLSGGAPGMGPAYFTKLIFFLAPQTDGNSAPGYIMDQWTACSVNLLLGDQKAVLTDCSYSWNRRGQLDSHYTVSNCNDGDRYERFCSAVEALADQLELSPTETELLLLSEGGKQPLKWRSYVKQHRRPAFA